MTKRKRPASQNANEPSKENSTAALRTESVGESVVNPEFDSKIDALANSIRLNKGLTSHEEEDSLAHTMFENDEREFGNLDLAAQLEWFDRKLGNHSDAVLLRNESAKTGVRQKYLKKLLNARLKLQKELDFKQRAFERQTAIKEYDTTMEPEVDEPDVPKKFTRKQVMYLLQELIPDFKNAENTRKAEFIIKLTPYNGEKNISDEYSNIRNFADPTLLAHWKEKFMTSGRGRKKKSS